MDKKCTLRSDASLGQALAKRAVEIPIDRILDAIAVHPFARQLFIQRVQSQTKVPN
jgi:hypothetical protein